MQSDRTSLGELARLFLRIGSTAFGGPIVHIARMREQVVERRAWLSEQHFLDLLAATQLIPGPNSTELAIHIGWERRRWAGLLVAGTAFILPAMLSTMALAAGYTQLGALPQAAAVSLWIKPVVLAIVVQALASFAPSAASTPRLRALALVVMLASACGVDELLLLAAAGAFQALTSRAEREHRELLALVPVAVGAAPTLLPSGLALFATFLKIGSVLYGSGYVLVAFLQRELVEHLGWLSSTQVMDAVAVGQLTPGPVFTTATFAGYLVLGPRGALLATVGIFLPAFVFVALSGPLVPRLRRSATARAAIAGVNAASLALMATACVPLVRSSVVDAKTACLALSSFAVLWVRPAASVWLLAGSALCGLALSIRG